jgi:predicted aldo/keto reductase-like oxidoreductase
VPTVPDCYRFALSHPAVDVVLTGVTDRDQIDQALEAVEKGPLSSGELEFMREYGSLFRHTPPRAA